MRFLGFAVLFVIVFVSSAYARSQQEISARANELSRQANSTQDLNKLNQLMQEAMSLSEDAGALAAAQGVKVLPSKPAATPDKEMERRREVINIQNKQVQGFIGARAQSDEMISIPSAVQLEGTLLVEGGELDNPRDGVIPTDLKYMVTENFVGNLIVMQIYDPKTGSFTGKKEYMIDSLSKEIKVNNLGGRKCVKWSSSLPQSCVSWAVFSRSHVDAGSKYPGFYAGVVSAETENGNVKIEADAPDVLFSSPLGEASAKLGCFGANWTMSASDFERLLDRSEIVLTKDVSREAGPAPGCRLGSAIKLKLKLKEKDCSIEVEGDDTLIDDCMGADGMAPSVRLRAEYKKSIAPAKWSVVSGADKIKFTLGGQNSLMPRVELRALGKSEMEDDITIEAEVKKGSNTCVAVRTLTARRPELLRRLSDEETLAVGLNPYISYNKLCEEGRCVKPDIPALGRESLDVIDGYNRISANALLDQFAKPIRRDGLLWYEDRVARVGNKKIEIEQAVDGGTLVPVNPSQPNGDKMNMISQDYKTEAGGHVADHLRVMYTSDTRGVPENLDITVDQKIRVFSCPVADCVQHYMRTDATHVCKEPAR